MISLIWAQDENSLIGDGGQLPWRLPADMAWFRKNTMGKPIFMGRKTFDSIGRPLPGRTNIVLTSQDIKIDGCTVVHSLAEAVTVTDKTEELMVMGGAQIYKLTLPRANRLYITQIHAVFEGDAWFPAFDKSMWRETFHECHKPDARNMYPFSFRILERTDKAGESNSQRVLARKSVAVHTDA
ncbi:MAG: type 3 dihydrofolate reductase [Mariprofundaceae bacterium]|nr:type 3 dihydrofolate reductase [Mariprofundaceae bacterium]